MKLFITSLIIVLLNVGTKHTERKETIKTQNINTVKKATLKTFTYEDIARYTMASIMGQQPKIITATKKGDLYYVSYIRKSDNIKFDYKIKFEGNKILWSNIDGRWRNSQYDEKVTFIEKKQ